MYNIITFWEEKFMKKMRLLSLILVFTMAVNLFAGCTKADEDNSSQTTVDNGEATTETENGQETEDTSGKKYDGVTLKWAVTETGASTGENVELIEKIKEDLGINIEFTIVPTPKDGEIDRTLVSLMAGDELDIVYSATPSLKIYQSAGVLTPLDELAENMGYDMKEVFGENLPVFDGAVYGLPAYSDIWLTFYNKKVFDDAGVPYPEAEGWTWEKYIETAEKLTDIENGVWGSYMLDYNNYYYMYATQKGADAYKADGTSNFDDPLYSEALKFFADLGNEKEIQPTMGMLAAGEYPWNAFAASDNIGMFVCGGWVTSLLKNHEKYPREWKAGILPMPYPEGSEASTLVVNGNYAIPTTSANKEAAFEAVKYMAENQYELGYGRVPARVNLSDEEITRYIEEELGADFVDDGITVEDFRAGWFDAERIPYPEKIIGTADTSINQIWFEEAQEYGLGIKPLEETMQSIQERSNRAIEEAKQ